MRARVGFTLSLASACSHDRRMGDQAVAHGVPPGPGDALNEEPNQGLGNAIPIMYQGSVKVKEEERTSTSARSCTASELYLPHSRKTYARAPAPEGPARLSRLHLPVRPR